MTASISTNFDSGCPEPISFTEAIKDSPRFRHSLLQHVLYLNRLENRLNEVLRHVNGMIDFSRSYISSFYKLTVSVNQLCDESFTGSAVNQTIFRSLSDAMGQTMSLSKTYFEESSMALYSRISVYLKQQLVKVNESKAHFEAMSASMDEALLKNASIPKTRPSELIDGRNALTAVGACFAHTTLDYVSQIYVALANKDQVIIDGLWSFVRESSSYFSRGHACFDEWTAADNGHVSDTIGMLASKTKHIERKMQDIHSLVPKRLHSGTITQTESSISAESVGSQYDILPELKMMGKSSDILQNLHDCDASVHTGRSAFYSYVHLPSTPESAPKKQKKGSKKLKSQSLLSPKTKLTLPAEKQKTAPQLSEYECETSKQKDHLRRRRKLSKADISAPVPFSFSHDMFQHASGMSPDPDVMMEGYLMKRSSNAFKTWNRRWFQIKDNKLLYCHRSNEYESPTVMEENLMLCLVRPAAPSVDRIGCFELVTPSRTHLLQADSEALCNSWMRALQRTILALHESDDTTTKPSSSRSDTSNSLNTGTRLAEVDTSTAFEQIRRVPGNDRCADCGSEQPKWVSINLGVILCIECSGVHRSLGVQVSKVRSLTMDSIDAELRDVLLSLGNTQVNSIYLAHMPNSDVVPPEATENCARQVREAWIKAKYVERRFAMPNKDRTRSTANYRQEHLVVRQKSPINAVLRSSSYADVGEAEGSVGIRLTASSKQINELDVPTQHLAAKRLSSCGSDPNISALVVDESSWSCVGEAARSGDILQLLRAMAHNIDVNGVCEGTTALHLATQNGQTAVVEFLLLNGSKVNVLDDRMNTPLHLAALEGNTLQVCQLLKRGADASLKNAEGVTPLDIAVDGKHADIVTLFRVHTMRDEFNEEFDNPMNETVDNVISDITRRAATNRRQ